MRNASQSRPSASAELSLALSCLESAPAASLVHSRNVLEALVLDLFRAGLRADPEVPKLADMLLSTPFARTVDGRMLSRMAAVSDMAARAALAHEVTSEDAERTLDNVLDIVRWHADSSSATALGADADADDLEGAGRLAAGALIAEKYVVGRRLGQGGMGEVYEAHHAALQRKVAIKVLLEEGARSPEVLARFEREAGAAGRLEHENIARVYDFGRLPDGMPFLVMEYLDGEDMSSWILQNRPTPLADVVSLAIQACRGIAEAHRQRVVHRDIKPSNLFIAKRPDGSRILKIVDFGIAKTRAEGSSDLFQTVASIGSPLYMSPEQLLDPSTVDERTDIWSLGATLYEAILGEPAFPAGSLAALHVMILTGTPDSLCAARSDVPSELERIVFRCLSKKRDDRFADMAELRAALSALSTSLAVHLPSSSFLPVTARDGSPPSMPPPRVPALAATHGALAASVGEARLAPSTNKTLGTYARWLAFGGLLAVGALGFYVQRTRASGGSSYTGEPGAMAVIPRGTVTIDEGVGDVVVASFSLDVTEVTVAAYSDCVKAGACNAEALTEYGACNWGKPDKRAHPINCVDWSQAKSYCSFVGKRLPTEAEWQLAAEGAQSRQYPWGPALPTSQVCWDGEGNDLGRGNRHSTCAVGATPSGDSAQGVKDLSGNVWEWTDSCGGNDCSLRVTRGGSWLETKPSHVVATARHTLSTSDRDYDLGFRCGRAN